MKISPLQQYQLDLNSPGFVSDPAQLKAAKALTRIHKSILHNQGWMAKLSRRFSSQKSVRGLYMWGRVGSGKTYLMDTFFNGMPENLRKRVHFHKFMQHVNKRLNELQGKREPLYRIARDFFKDAKVICFDEFFIDDIGDAMILGNLLKHIFSLGITLVFTSNIPPDELYKDGLQRQRFLPTIALLKKHNQVLEVNTQLDYRLKDIATKGHYFTPLDETAAKNMQNSFDYYSHKLAMHGNKLDVNNHELLAVRCAHGVLWVSFDELCKKPRHVKDYLVLSRDFHTILIADVPVLKSRDNNAVKRLIHAVDVFYDEKIRVIISAETDIDNLYEGQLCAEKFKRAASRLHEMQTKAYLEKAVARKYSS